MDNRVEWSRMESNGVEWSRMEDRVEDRVESNEGQSGVVLGYEEWMDQSW